MNPMPLFAAVAFALTALPLTAAYAQTPSSPPVPAVPSAAAPHQSSALEPVKPSLPASYPVEYPAPPTDGIYVSDSGVILTIDEQRTVNKAAAHVKATTGLPVMVVTISSLEIMGAGPKVTINEYGRELFKHWSVQSAQDDRGVLLLLSRNDRQACAVLGAGWGTAQDAFKQRVEDVTLIPTAAAGNAYASGLIRAVNEVSAMYISAGYPKEMPAGAGAGDRASPAALPSGAGEGGSAPVVPPAPGPLGAFVWVGIGVVAIGILVALALMAIASKRSQG